MKDEKAGQIQNKIVCYFHCTKTASKMTRISSIEPIVVLIYLEQYYNENTDKMFDTSAQFSFPVSWCSDYKVALNQNSSFRMMEWDEIEME